MRRLHTQELRGLVAPGSARDKGEVLAAAVAEVARLRAANEDLAAQLSQLSLSFGGAGGAPPPPPIVALVSPAALPLSSDAIALRAAAYDSLPVGVVLCRHDGLILDVNGTLCRELGYPDGGVLRGTWAHDLTGCTARAKSQFMALRAGKVTEVQLFVEMLEAAGTRRPAWLRVTVGEHAGAPVIHFVLVFKPRSEVGPCPLEAERAAAAAGGGGGGGAADARFCPLLGDSKCHVVGGES